MRLSRIVAAAAASLAPALLLPAARPACADEIADKLARMVAAYPDFLQAIEGNTLIWKDGTRMPIDDGKGVKTREQVLADPDIEDTFEISYPVGEPPTPPGKDIDPGRARYLPMFNKMYGDCKKGEVDRHLTTIAWLPKKTHQKLRVTKVNGVAEKLAAVSAELEALPDSFNVYLVRSAGTYNCRSIAGTNRPSAHGQGIAIDIALKRTDYWRWEKPGPDGLYPYKNRIPMEIVRIFEKHGFIWGGRWYHYDTMHFEYRPELLMPETTSATAR